MQAETACDQSCDPILGVVSEVERQHQMLSHQLMLEMPFLSSRTSLAQLLHSKLHNILDQSNASLQRCMPFPLLRNGNPFYTFFCCLCYLRNSSSHCSFFYQKYHFLSVLFCGWKQIVTLQQKSRTLVSGYL